MKAALLNALSSQSLPSPLSPLQHQKTLQTNDLEDIIEFIQQDSEASSEVAHAQTRLAHALLLEPVTLTPTMIQALAHRLPDEQLIKLVFELRPPHAQRLNSKSNKLAEQQLDLHAEELISTLVVRATQRGEYHQFIHEKPQLANLLMKKRLETLTTPKNQQALITELLTHHQHYDWHDKPFSTLVYSRILPVLRQLPEKEFKHYFKLYYSQDGQMNRTELAQLIRELAQNTSTTHWIQSCINQDKVLHQNPSFITLFLETLKPNQDVIDDFLKTINNLDLLNLILFLIELHKKPDSKAEVLDKALDCFCLRLLHASGHDHDSIHEWQRDKTKASLLALHLASKPTRLQSLSSFSTIAYGLTPARLQGYLIKSAAEDLKNRSIAVIAAFECNDEAFKEIALKTLCYFRTTPLALQTLFKNLESACITPQKTEQQHHHFKTNYQRFKKACWEWLTPSLPYEESAVTNVLTTQLINAHSFDSLLIALIQHHAHDATTGAFYLSQIDSKSIRFLEPVTLVSVLLQSSTKETSSNWQKAGDFLNKSHPEDQLAFTKALIEQTQSQEIMGNQAWKLITKLPSLNHFMVELSFPELQWLIVTGPQDELKKYFSGWLDSLLLKTSLFDAINVDALLALLPADLNFLEALFANKKLMPYFPRLFIKFAKQEINTSHQVALFKHINALKNAEKQDFISNVQQSLFDQQATNCALPVLTTLLLTLQTLSIHDRKAKELIKNQLRLFNQVTHHADFNPAASPELQQSLFNLLNYLNAHNSLWVNDILNDASFADLAPLWLKTMDPEKQNHHLFTQLLMEHTSTQIHPNLLKNPDYQDYLQHLLSYPPDAMTNDRFNLLFTQQLSSTNQKSLARELLKKSNINQLNNAKRLTLSRGLNITELYEIAANHEFNISGTLIELIAHHPDGLDKLSESNRTMLLSNLKSHQQLLRILDGQASSQCKINFVNHVFIYLLHHKIMLSEWLSKLHVDGQTLAAFANYTTAPHHQQLIKNTFKSSTETLSFRLEIKDYLQNPTLTSPIEPHGLLCWLIQDAFLTPQRGWQCHPSLFTTINDSEEAHPSIVRNQFLFLNEVHQLRDFYTPFEHADNELKAPLTAARWLHQLPLLSQGLLQLIQDYPKLSCPRTRAACQKTRLYTQLMEPLFSGKLSHDKHDLTPLLTIQLNDLYDLLIEYKEAIELYDRQYSDDLNHVIQKYQIKLQAIEHGSFLGAYNLFHPQSSTEKIKQRPPTLNRDENRQLLNQASFLHDQHMAKTFAPCNYLTSLIESVIQHPKWIKGKSDFQAWIFTCLTSPLISAISPKVLTQLFTHYPTHALIDLINAYQKKLTQFQFNFNQLTTLATLTNLEDMLKFLLSADLPPLLQSCEFAELPYLTNLIHFALQIQNTRLPYDQLITFLLPSPLTKNFELNWLKIDFEKLDETKTRLIHCHNTLILASFRYRPLTKQQPLTQLHYLTSITSNSPTLIACLYSYLPMLKLQETLLGDQFLGAMINLFRHSSKPDDFIRQLPQALLSQMMNAALKSPEKYKLFIMNLMDAREPAQYLNEVQTQLTALVHQYALIDEFEIINQQDLHVILANLSADEIAQIEPHDFKRILFLQRLFLQMSPLPEFENWVHDDLISDKKTRAYFAADASLYEQIINLPKQTMTLHVDDKTNHYSINIQNAYRFIAQNNYAFIYDGLTTQFTQPDALIAPNILYHYLNVASIVSNDTDILEQDRINLSKQLKIANLPLDKVKKLHKNCPSKIIYLIYSAHLLSRPDFIATLPGKVMFDALNSDSPQRIKKRLSPFVQSIDLSLIPKEALQLLEPEAAATFFCSVPHFHQLNEKNIPILLERVGTQRDSLINYWIHVYSAMPNYEAVLLQLMGLYPEKVTLGINKLPLSQRQKILSALINQFNQEQKQDSLIENKITTLSQLLHDCLRQCEQASPTEFEKLELQTMMHQLIGRTIQKEPKQILRHQVWKSLKESNGKLMAYSLQKETQQFIRALSSQKKPEQLLELFDAALVHLHGDDKTKKIVEIARNEAAVEHHLSQLRIFKTLRSWLKRCSFYGWTGFFTPKQPIYLAPLTKTRSQHTNVITPTPFEQLTQLMNTITSESTNREIILLLNVLTAYEQEPKNREDEILLRRKIDLLFNQLIEKSQSMHDSDRLFNRMKPLLINRKQLIALYSASGQHEALQHLLITAQQGPGPFNDVLEEWLNIQEEDVVLDATQAPSSLTTPLATRISYLSAIAEPFLVIPNQLRAIPEQLRKVPEQLRALPGQLRAIPKDWGHYFNGPFNFFAQQETQHARLAQAHAQHLPPPLSSNIMK